jgi:hypothetical protein
MKTGLLKLTGLVAYIRLIALESDQELSQFLEVIIYLIESRIRVENRDADTKNLCDRK